MRDHTARWTRRGATPSNADHKCAARGCEAVRLASCANLIQRLSRMEAQAAQTLCVVGTCAFVACNRRGDKDNQMAYPGIACTTTSLGNRTTPQAHGMSFVFFPERDKPSSPKRPVGCHPSWSPVSLAECKLGANRSPQAPSRGDLRPRMHGDLLSEEYDWPTHCLPCCGSGARPLPYRPLCAMHTRTRRRSKPMP